MATDVENRIFQFGAFELDRPSGELRKNGVKIKLQGQPVQILTLLLDRPGELVTRDEIRRGLWPDNTFIDFDNAISSAVWKIREALGDNSENPRFVHTIARRGYRFVAPVSVRDRVVETEAIKREQPQGGANGIAPDQSEGVGAQPFAAAPAEASGPNGVQASDAGSSLLDAIETLSRKGYRFIAPVDKPTAGEVVATEALASAPAAVARHTNTRRYKVLFSGIAGGAATLALVAALNVGGWRDRIRAVARTAEISSLAVLPFENLARDLGDEYFADGITDELIASLGKIGALRVISRTSAMSYKGTRKPLSQIARELHVEGVVEGSVLQLGERVRIIAQLVRVNPEKQLWAESYERDARDVLALQEDLARDIAREIRVKITTQEQNRLSRSRRVDPQAHEDYLRGMYFQNKRTEADLEKGVAYFKLAIRKDPSYAPAYAALGNSYHMQTWYGHAAPRENCPKARDMALRALALDATVAEAHAVLAFYKKVYEQDLRGSEREFRLALELNPGFALAHVWRGEVLTAMGRHAEALAELDRARELDPTSLTVSDQRGLVLYMARRYDEAIEQIRKTLELEPRFAHAHCWLGKVYLQKGLLAQGLGELEQMASFPGGDGPLLASWLGYAYALSGKRAEAYRVLGTLKAQEQKSFASPYGLAAIYSGLGEKDQALVWLEKAYQERDPLWFYVRIEPAFDPLRSYPRFQALLRRTMFLKGRF